MLGRGIYVSEALLQDILLIGVKPAGVLLDELHEIAKNPAAERLIG